MITKFTQFELKLWLSWVAANVLGLLVAGTFVSVVSSLDEYFSWPSNLGPILFGASAILAYSQWLVLKSLSRRRGRLLIVSTVAWLIGFILILSTYATLVAGFTESSFTLLRILYVSFITFSAGAIAGGILGSLQSLILKDTLHQSWHWIVANSLGMALGCLVYFDLAEVVQNRETALQILIKFIGVYDDIVWFVLLAISGVISSSFTGSYLVRLLKMAKTKM